MNSQQDHVAAPDRAPAHETAVVLPLPGLQPALQPGFTRGWRPIDGVPAHITLVYPFLPLESIDGRVEAELRRICGGTSRMELTFAETGGFPGVAYLAPDHVVALQHLIRCLSDAWPQALPYEGRFRTIIPHLTVAQDLGEPLLEEVRREVEEMLPLRGRADHAELYVSDGYHWRPRMMLPLGLGRSGS